MLPAGSLGSSLPLNIVIDERENRLLQQSGIISRFWALIRGSSAPREHSRRGAAGESSPLRSNFSPPDELIKQLVPDEVAACLCSTVPSRLRFGLAAGARTLGLPPALVPPGPAKRALLRGACGHGSHRCPPPLPARPVTHPRAAGRERNGNGRPAASFPRPINFPPRCCTGEK